MVSGRRENRRPFFMTPSSCLYFSFVFLALTLQLPPQAPAEVLDQPLASSGSHEQAFNDAMALKNEGRLVEAEGKLQEALQSAPGNPAYHFELANLYALQHDAYQEISSARSDALLGRVAHELDQTLMLDPDFLPAQYNLAVTYKRLEDYERAREELRRLMDKAGQKGDLAMKRSAQMQIGYVYEEQGFFDEARDSFLAAQELDYANQDARDALENLKMHQRWKEEKTRRQDLGRGLSQMQQSVAEVNARSRYNSSNPYSTPYAGAQQSASSGQMVASLGSMLAQQFLGRGSSDGN